MPNCCAKYSQRVATVTLNVRAETFLALIKKLDGFIRNIFSCFKSTSRTSKPAINVRHKSISNLFEFHRSYIEC